MRLRVEWANDSGAMRARGIIVLVKSSYLVKKYRDFFRKLKLDINPISPQNITNMADAFRY